MPANPMPSAPEIIGGAAPPQSEQPQDEEHREELQPDFVNRITAVENKSGRDGHGERGQPADVAPDERFEFERQKNANDADQHHRQPQGPDVAPEQCLREEENVEMERAVIIRRVVPVEAVLGHLIDEPAVDSLVEVGRLHPEQEKAQEGGERDDRPGHPIDFGGALFQIGQPFAPRGKNC